MSSLAFARPFHPTSPRPLPAINVRNSFNFTSVPSATQSSQSRDDSRPGDSIPDEEEEEDEADSDSPPASHSPQGLGSVKKIRRTHARRSCLACRKRKARCELPDITVPSCMTPLQQALKCHRCKTLDTDCIVWDGDRKMRGDRPARYGPPQAKLAAASQRTAAKSAATRVRPRGDNLSMSEDIDGESDASTSKRKLPRTASSGRGGGSAGLANGVIRSYLPADPRTQGDWSPAIPRLRHLSILPRTVEQRRAQHLANTTEEVIDSFSVWDNMEDVINPSAKGPTARSEVRSAPKRGSTAGPRAAVAQPMSAFETLPVVSSGKESEQFLASAYGQTGNHSRDAVPVVHDTKPFSMKRGNDYKGKLTTAAGRNAALLSEIIYGAPEYRDRSQYVERTVYAYRGVPVVDKGVVPRHKVEALIRAHPFLSPELVDPVPDDADPTSGRVFLSNVVNYLCLRPNPPPELSAFVIRHSSIHVIMQTRNREICQAMLLLVLHDPTDMLMNKPAHDPDVQIDHVPGQHLSQAAMNCALSLGLDRVIPNLCSGRDALTSASSIEDRMARLRDAALWLTISNMAVSDAVGTARPQLPTLYPSLGDIQVYQTSIRPLLSASREDNARLLPEETRDETKSKSTSSARHPAPLTYQALAVSLTILGQRSRHSFRIRTFWKEVSNYDGSESSSILPICKLILALTTDLAQSQHGHIVELKELEDQVQRSAASASIALHGFVAGGRGDPVTDLLTKWGEIHFLDVTGGLAVRLLFSMIAPLAAQTGVLTKAGAYKGLDTLDANQSTAITRVALTAQRGHMRILHLAISLATSAGGKFRRAGPQGSNTTDARQPHSRLSTADDGRSTVDEVSPILHLIPHFQFCTAVFSACRQTVEHVLFISFGVGTLVPQCKTTLAVMQRAIGAVELMGRGDPLSLPTISAHVLQAFCKTFGRLIDMSEERKSKLRSAERRGVSAPNASRNGGRNDDDRDATHDNNNKVRHHVASNYVRDYLLPMIERSEAAGEDGSGSDMSDLHPGVTGPSGLLLHPSRNEMHSAPSNSRHNPERGDHSADSQGFWRPSDSYNDVDGMLAAMGGGTAAVGSLGSGGHFAQRSVASSPLQDYSHAILDQLVGSLDGDFMGFPTDTLLGSSASGSTPNGNEAASVGVLHSPWSTYDGGASLVGIGGYQSTFIAADTNLVPTTYPMQYGQTANTMAYPLGSSNADLPDSPSTQQPQSVTPMVSSLPIASMLSSSSRGFEGYQQDPSSSSVYGQGYDSLGHDNPSVGGSGVYPVSLAGTTTSVGEPRTFDGDSSVKVSPYEYSYSADRKETYRAGSVDGRNGTTSRSMGRRDGRAAAADEGSRPTSSYAAFGSDGIAERSSGAGSSLYQHQLTHPLQYQHGHHQNGAPNGKR